MYLWKAKLQFFDDLRPRLFRIFVNWPEIWGLFTPLINVCYIFFFFMMSKSKCWFPSWSFSFVMSYCEHIQNLKGYFFIFFIFSEKEANTLRRQIVNNKAKKANLKTGVSRKQSASNFPKKEHFSPPDTHMYVCLSKGKRYLFFGKFGVLYFLETPVSRFAVSGR